MLRTACRYYARILIALAIAVLAVFAWPALSWAGEPEDGAAPMMTDTADAVSEASGETAAPAAETPAKASASEPAPVQPQEPAVSEPVSTGVAGGGDAPAQDVAMVPDDPDPLPDNAGEGEQGSAPSEAGTDDVTDAVGDAADGEGASAVSEAPTADALPAEGASDSEPAATPEQAQDLSAETPATAAATAVVAAPKKTGGTTTPTAATAVKTPVLAAGTYLFTWAKKTSLIVQSAKLSTKAKASVVLGKRKSILRQRWIVKFDEKTGYYTIVNEQTKKVLAVKSKKNGSVVLQAKAKAGSKKQLWTVIKKGSNYIFIPKANKKLALTGKKKNGEYQLIVRKLTKSKVQQFSMKKGGIVRNGVYKIALTRKTSKVLGVEAASKNDGAKVKRGSYKAAQNQKFRITYRGNDLYTIEALHSGKFVGAKGAAIVQAANSKAAAQQWMVHWNKKGVAFKNAETGLRLNSAGTESAVTGQKASKSTDQRWKLTKVSPDPTDPIVDKALAKAKKRGSATNYFIAVDIKNHRTMIFKRSGGTWKLSKNWVCSTGAPGSPTPTGSWTVGIKGYSFGEGYTCYYYTQFWGDYLFHSVKYYQGTRTIKDGRLGKDVSEGCVRLDIKNAKWIYDYIPEDTRVVTYR